ncbi:ABC transporter ATP-binding protein [Streptomyces sp. S3(2020)]|uniref:ATP-binding cassette domain-containing protein n=1 Tax=Streptomyces sp. S3(2020) TaxID=2732044 RepID=UPI001489632B|nr:ABC transporter ATP-binding protein [Streptomyces sp. S3(2020)]NNN31124.1 ABC transporter ATP-binding protein [Streptomyces sp. S3(2020)]
MTVNSERSRRPVPRLWPLTTDPVALDVGLRAVDCAGARRLSLDIAPGERVVLTGRDRATGTALLRAVAGLIPVGGGQITVGGRGSRTPAERAWRGRACAWLPRVLAPVRSGAPAAGVLVRGTHPTAAAFAADLLGVGRLRDRPLRSLTPGETRRLHWARVVGRVAAGAGVLLADDPGEGLEPDDRDALVRLLAALPVTLLMATADPALTALCDRRVGMNPGRPGPARSPAVADAEPNSPGEQGN